jgi:hypothetical protein
VDRSATITLDGAAHAGAIDPSGRRLLRWTDPSSVDVWDLVDARVLATLHLAGEFTPIGFDASGTRVLLQEQPGMFGAGLSELFDVETGRRLRSLAGNGIVFDPSRQLVTAFGSGRVEVWRAIDAAVLSSARIRRPGLDDSNPLANASSDGAFIVAFDEDRSVAVLDARDGRLLDRVDVVHMRGAIFRRLGFGSYGQFSHWIPGTHTLVAFGGHTAVWDLQLEGRTPEAIHELVTARVPWLVADGALVARLGAIEGRLVRAPASDVRVFAKRTPQNVVYEAITAADGSFRFTELPFGTYVVSAGAATGTANITTLAPVHVEL